MKRLQIRPEFEGSLLVAMATLGDKLLENAAWLGEQGFGCHLSAALTERRLWLTEDAMEYERYLVEEAKEIIGDPSINISTLFGDSEGYRSPWLDQKRKERDEKLGSQSRLDVPWLFELNPVRQAAARLKSTPEGFKRWQQLDREQQSALEECRAKEALRYAMIAESKSVKDVVEDQLLCALDGWKFATVGQGDVLLLRGPSIGPLQLCASVSLFARHIEMGRLYISAHFRHSDNAMKGNSRDSFGNLPRRFQIPIKFQWACLGFSAYFVRNKRKDALAAACVAHGRLLSHLLPEILATAEAAIHTHGPPFASAK